MLSSLSAYALSPVLRTANVCRILIAAALFSTLLPTSGWAQPPADAGAAQQQFDNVFDEWKESLKVIRELQTKYQAATDAERPAIEAEFQTKIAAAKVLVPKLKSAAMAAYEAAPNKNKDVADFMGSILADAVNKDDYEEAYDVAKLLHANNTESDRLELFAGLAAFATNHFDEVSDLLKAAGEKGQMQASPQGASEFQQRTLQNAGQAMSVLDEYKGFWAEEQKIRAAEAAADDLPRVKLKTNKGDIVIELFENEAPNTVANFINLVEDGFYDGLTFHRVIPGFMAQGGCPTGDGTGGPDHQIPCECYQDNYRKHFRGTLSMAHAGKDTGGSQFFLTYLPTPHLNGKHTAFGRVIEGIDVLSQLERHQPGSRIEPDKIEKATVERKREHEYKVKKLPARG
jgi:cyclophilin family peptidyl-prolyl cis-trans isomerase